MDEPSWRAKLLKANINITNIDYENRTIYFDFAYRPGPGKPQRWAKTFAWLEEDAQIDMGLVAEQLKENVLELRKELEG